MHWNLACANHIGGRREQQDRCATFSQASAHLLVLADGMGGHQGGSLAAEAVVAAGGAAWAELAREITTVAPNFVLRRVCEEAQARIHAINREQDIYPHSTCVVLFLRDYHAWWTHLGDSRLYHFRGERMLSRTRDHSVVQMLVDMGRVRDEDMGRHPDQGRLLKGLGGDERLALDYFEAATQPEDFFLLCSDGLWEQVQPSEMPARVLQPPALAQAAQALVDLAAERGGDGGDNVAVALARPSH